MLKEIFAVYYENLTKTTVSVDKMQSYLLLEQVVHIVSKSI
jgi:hypothetical protein